MDQVEEVIPMYGEKRISSDRAKYEATDKRSARAHLLLLKACFLGIHVVPELEDVVVMIAAKRATYLNMSSSKPDAILNLMDREIRRLSHAS